jgi:hypothetical protein
MSAPGSPGAHTTMSSEPPVIAPRSTTVEQMRNSNPVFERAAGRLVKPPPASRAGAAPRFEGLSASTLELDGFGFRDAAEGDSVLFSDTGSRAGDPSVSAAASRAWRGAKKEASDGQKGPAKRKANSCVKREQGVDDDSDGRDDDDDNEENEEAYEPSSKRQKEEDDEDAIAQAAFGGGLPDRDDRSQASSVQSERSSVNRRNVHCAAFPVATVDCVGCSLLNEVGVVTNYVMENINRMGDDALWKQAALVFKKCVQDPRAKECVYTPGWSWKDIRLHYLVHSNNDFIARATTCRQLQTLRHAYSLRLVRVENGERELDRANADFLLKVVNAESRERQLMAASSTCSSTASRTAAGRGAGGGAQ